MSHFNACCIQTNSTSKLDENIKNLIPLIEKSVKKKSDIIFLPECVGIFTDSKPLLKSFNVNNKFLDFIKESCIKFKLFIVVGSIPVKSKNNKFFNRSFLISPKGKIVGFYDKINLFDVILNNNENYMESKNFDAGKDLKVFKLPWGKIGLSICYDLRFPSLYKELAKKGTHFFSIPAAFTKTTGKHHWESLVKSRAIENGCFVFAPAQCGKHDNGRETYGHSLIVDPWGKILSQGSNKPGIIFSKIDLNLIENSRSKIPAMTDYKI